MRATNNVSKAVRRIGLMSGVALIAISASVLGSSVAAAATPATQIAEGQQPNSAPQWQNQKHGNNQQNGQGQNRQWGQNGQGQWQQNGQGWNRQWGQNGQGQWQQNGQGWNRQWGQNGQGQWQQNGQGWNRQWGQNGQGQWQQNGQGWNPQWGQNGQGQWQQNGQGWNRQWTQQYGQGQWQQWGGQGGQQQWKHRYDWSAYHPGRRPPEWDRYRRDFDPRPYEWNRVSERRYRWEPYVEPPGWYYQRWAYGEILPEIFWSQQYWLADYAEFGLYDPPYGYVWVRYGDDALLVDVESGQILSVEYGLFYS